MPFAGKIRAYAILAIFPKARSEFSRSKFFGIAFILATVIAPDAIAQDTQSKSQPQPQSRPEFIWAVPPFAPAFIKKDGVLGGYGADTQNWFAARLPHYDHRTLDIPLARLLAEMKTGDGALRCSSTLIPTPERRTYIAFARTVLLHLPISIIIRAKDENRFAPYLNAQGHVDIKELVKNTQLTSAVRIGRAYGSGIDKYINPYRHNHQVAQVADDTKLMRLLDLGRLDWALYFPSEAEYYRREQTPDLAIKALPIANNTTLLEATIGCADTPAGRKAVAEINAIIDAHPTMPWTEFYANWLGENDREWFNAARDQYIRAEHFETRLEYRPSSAQ